MKKPQWITLGIASFFVVGLFAATQARFFGDRTNKKLIPPTSNTGSHGHGITVDTILYHAKKSLPQEQSSRLTFLENSVSGVHGGEQKMHLMHQLARYWMDSARAFTPMFWYPYAWYSAEAARLENSSKSLSFAAHLFLNALVREEAHELKDWEAEQAKDLFQRSLKLNPQNDSAKVGLGATILYGGHEAPMAGITMIREVADKNPSHVFAQMTLGEASLMSGQLDKAAERFRTVVELQSSNLPAHLLLADTYEKLKKKPEAIEAYQKLLPLVTNVQMKAEVQKRVNELKTK